VPDDTVEHTIRIEGAWRETIAAAVAAALDAVDQHHVAVVHRLAVQWCESDGRPGYVWAVSGAGRPGPADRVRALHARRDLAGDDICEACGTAWPCATTRALDGEQER